MASVVAVHLHPSQAHPGITVFGPKMPRYLTVKVIAPAPDRSVRLLHADVASDPDADVIRSLLLQSAGAGMNGSVPVGENVNLLRKLAVVGLSPPTPHAPILGDKAVPDAEITNGGQVEANRQGLRRKRLARFFDPAKPVAQE